MHFMSINHYTAHPVTKNSDSCCYYAMICGCYIKLLYRLAPVCQKLAVIGFFKRFGPKWVFPSIQGAVEFAKSGEKVVSKL